MCYEIRQGLLHRDGMALSCPFQQLLPKSAKLGQVTLEHQGCGPYCALFKITKFSFLFYFRLTCSKMSFFKLKGNVCQTDQNINLSRNMYERQN